MAEVCRKHGIAQSTLYAWRKKFGNMDVSEARRLRQLEDENRKLKRLVADLSLDNQMLKDVNSKSGKRLGKARSSDASARGVSRKQPASCRGVVGVKTHDEDAQ